MNNRFSYLLKPVSNCYTTVSNACQNQIENTLSQRNNRYIIAILTIHHHRCRCCLYHSLLETVYLYPENMNVMIMKIVIIIHVQDRSSTDNNTSMTSLSSHTIEMK